MTVFLKGILFKNLKGKKIDFCKSVLKMCWKQRPFFSNLACRTTSRKRVVAELVALSTVILNKGFTRSKAAKNFEKSKKHLQSHFGTCSRFTFPQQRKPNGVSWQRWKWKPCPVGEDLVDDTSLKGLKSGHSELQERRFFSFLLQAICCVVVGNISKMLFFQPSECEVGWCGRLQQNKSRNFGGHQAERSWKACFYIAVWIEVCFWCFHYICHFFCHKFWEFSKAHECEGHIRIYNYNLLHLAFPSQTSFIMYTLSKGVRSGCSHKADASNRASNQTQSVQTPNTKSLHTRWVRYFAELR